MDELAIADVHSDMADGVDVIREKHKIAGLELVLIDMPAVRSVLTAGAALETIAVLAVDIVD